MNDQSAIQKVVVVERLALRDARKEWDAFAMRCGASYYCAMAYVISQLPRVRLFAIFCAGDKVGQCAVTTGRSRRFLDSLQLLPGHDYCWASAMQQILADLGPGDWDYSGSYWNMEPPRDSYFARISGVTILESEPYEVEAVNFAAQPDWATYERSLATNARRNAAKSRKTDPAATIVYAHGVSAVRQTAIVTKLRHATWTRKGLGFAPGVMAVRYAMRCCLYRRYSWTGWIVHSGRTAAVMTGIDYGNNLFYIDGASLPDNGGAAWHLLIETMRQSYQRHPHGRFVMGVDRGPAGNKEGWENLERSRQQCRVSRFPSSRVQFRYMAD